MERSILFKNQGNIHRIKSEKPFKILAQQIGITTMLNGVPNSCITKKTQIHSLYPQKQYNFKNIRLSLQLES